ncbi:hypothetical protein RRG08_023668 [Elysia crispata]|uniref:Uncharacterized protein n=1 Tax=Elysia crispata TaxID=231223 RepID=A0AAE0XSK5_9GAST|nr:hypothetical protein RRG08_023668 [Elysia crispata]
MLRRRRPRRGPRGYADLECQIPQGFATVTKGPLGQGFGPKTCTSQAYTTRFLIGTAWAHVLPNHLLLDSGQGGSDREEGRGG